MFGAPVTLILILLVAAAAGLVLYRVARPGITDSPWFWLFAFSAMGLIGLLAISPKYDDRQKRLEARYEGRQKARQSVPSAPSLDSNRAIDADESESPEQYDYQARRKVPLHFLAAALLLLSIATGYMLIYSSQSSSRTLNPEP
jgi:hypothetical protein